MCAKFIFTIDAVDKFIYYFTESIYRSPQYDVLSNKKFIIPKQVLIGGMREYSLNDKFFKVMDRWIKK